MNRIKTIFIIIAFIATTGLVATAFAHGGWDGDGYGGHMMGYGTGNGIGPGMMGYGYGYGMGIGMLLFWGLVVFAVVSLISGFFSKTSHPNSPEGHSDDALEILKKRYARGEIDKAEFDAKRRDLKA